MSPQEKVLWISRDKAAGDMCRAAFHIAMDKLESIGQ